MDILAGGRQRIADVFRDEIRASPREGLRLPLPTDARLMRIARSLLDDLGNERGLAEWAAHGALSARSLSRRFLAETGFTFADWRQRARLMRAVEMLAAGTPVTAIALSLGYGNVSAFIAMFRRVHGITPARFLASRATPAYCRRSLAARPSREQIGHAPIKRKPESPRLGTANAICGSRLSSLAGPETKDLLCPRTLAPLRAPTSRG